MSSNATPADPPMLFRNLVQNDSPIPCCRFRLDYRDGKWVTVGPSTVFTASLAYIFVTIERVIWVAKRSVRIGHIDIAHGLDVSFAGEIYFSGRKHRGKLIQWNNQSGHYRPGANMNLQARLPLDCFAPHETW